MKEQLLKVATKVFEYGYGWGEIIFIDENSNYPYFVRFKDMEDMEVAIFDIDGLKKEYFYYEKLNKDDKNPTLSLTEYDLINGGFTPLSDYNKPKVGDFGYFWDNDMENKKRLLYSEVTKISNINNNRVFYYDSIANDWENFSIEIPEWFKNIMNEEGRNK
jgi:hypothetical protein